MKDLAHHRKKLNHKIIRSARREENGEEIEPPRHSLSEKQKSKQAKIARRKQKSRALPKLKSEEERNLERKKGRTPIFDRNHALPKHAPFSKKKRPALRQST